MAKIIISSKGKTLQEIDLKKTISIGREVGDIKIKHPAVSARHAKIEKEGNSYSIQDLGSTNGTLVNDESITTHTLHDGDIITIGKYVLTFKNPDESELGAPMESLGGDDLGGRTMVMDSAQVQNMMGANKKAGGGGDSKLPKLFLTQAGGGAPTVIALSKDETVIGSADSVDIQIKGITIGKSAAVITKGDGGYTIEFKGGMAKLKVNGEPVETHTLKNGDKFGIGSYDFQFRTAL